MPLLDGAEVPLVAAQELKFFVYENERVIIRPDTPQFSFARGEVNSHASMGGVYLGTKKIAQLPLLWG